MKFYVKYCLKVLSVSYKNQESFYVFRLALNEIIKKLFKGMI
jgi:hypothetical protein